MDIRKHSKDRNKPVMRKRLKIAVFIAGFVCIALMVFRYFGFVSKTVYEESVSHLTEVFHQSDNMLRELTEKNLTYLHMWGENLQNTSSEDEIRDYIKKAQEDDMYPEFWTHIYKLGGHHGCFSVFYRRHPFCFCLDSFAIIVINIFINSNCKFFK